MRPSHIVVLIVVLIIIFGATKLPEIAKSIGQSAKVLKKEMKELQDDVPPESAQTKENKDPEAK
ncbi:twin-arginine translocase TatA/TatE family subunit [Arcanobacterium buesumense]|uniref:Sec-independent protein translocase protein TatA n=1 Tax=Arcanobacterium buesumense TaxID=2722751 RepID=A0A6H2EM71_9ACTO|nr:twin-arginine translocase TatA/TatE family subunit [Arcanobacterium buesumense]QJC22178.1 twin-arginine translocase TatA/TatE family subunit [Arcanobacterium buesumense]